MSTIMDDLAGLSRAVNPTARQEEPQTTMAEDLASLSNAMTGSEVANAVTGHIQSSIQRRTQAFMAGQNTGFEDDWSTVASSLRQQFPHLNQQAIDQIGQTYNQSRQQGYQGGLMQSYLQRARQRGAGGADWATYGMGLIPFSGGFSTAAHLSGVERSARRIQSGSGTDYDYRAVSDYIATQERTQAQGWASNVADTALRSLALGVEFYATGGVYNSVRNAVTGQVMRALPGRVAAGAQLAGRAPGAARVPGMAAGVAVQSGFMPGRVAETSQRRSFPRIGMSEGQINVQDSGTDPTQQVPNAFLHTGIEVAGERSGLYIMRGLGGLIRRTGGSRVRRLADTVSNLPLISATGQRARQYGFHGLIPEVLEERATEIGHYLTGLEPHGVMQGLWENARAFVDPTFRVSPENTWSQMAQQLGIEIPAFALVGGVHAVGRRARLPRVDTQRWHEERAALMVGISLAPESERENLRRELGVELRHFRLTPEDLAREQQQLREASEIEEWPAQGPQPGQEAMPETTAAPSAVDQSGPGQPTSALDPVTQSLGMGPAVQEVPLSAREQVGRLEAQHLQALQSLQDAQQNYRKANEWAAAGGSKKKAKEAAAAVKKARANLQRLERQLDQARVEASRPSPEYPANAPRYSATPPTVQQPGFSTAVPEVAPAAPQAQPVQTPQQAAPAVPQAPEASTPVQAPQAAPEAAQTFRERFIAQRIAENLRTGVSRSVAERDARTAADIRFAKEVPANSQKWRDTGSVDENGRYVAPDGSVYQLSHTEDTDGSVTVDARNNEGTVGRAIFTRDSNDSFVVGDAAPTFVREEHRGKRITPAMYDYFRSRIGEFTHPRSQTKEAERVWARNAEQPQAAPASEVVQQPAEPAQETTEPSLTERERRVMELLSGPDAVSLRKAGAMLGMSGENVRLIANAARAKLGKEGSAAEELEREGLEHQLAVREQREERGEVQTLEGMRVRVMEKTTLQEEMDKIQKEIDKADSELKKEIKRARQRGEVVRPEWKERHRARIAELNRRFAETSRRFYGEESEGTRPTERGDRPAGEPAPTEPARATPESVAPQATSRLEEAIRSRNRWRFDVIKEAWGQQFTHEEIDQTVKAIEARLGKLPAWQTGTPELPGANPTDRQGYRDEAVRAELGMLQEEMQSRQPSPEPMESAPQQTTDPKQGDTWAGWTITNVYPPGMTPTGEVLLFAEHPKEGGWELTPAEWNAFKSTQMESAPQQTQEPGQETTVDAAGNLRDAQGNVLFATAPVPVIGKMLKAGHSIGAILKKWFTSSGDLPASMFAAKIKRDGRIAAYVQDIKDTERDLRAATGPYRLLTEAQVQLMDDALRGDKQAQAQLPPQVRDVLQRMRDQVDALSEALLQSGAIQGKLVATFDANMGIYLHRAYQVFKDPAWLDKVPQDIKNRFISWFMAERAARGEAISREDAEGEMNALLYNGTAAESPIAFLAHSKLGEKDLSILMRRNEIAPELRALWGEYRDPLVNYANSVTHMASMLANHEFLTEVAQAGMGTHFFDKKTPTHFAPLAPVGNETMGPLAGRYTTPEIKKAFEDIYRREEMTKLGRIYMSALGVTKYAKTVLSHTTHIRNFIDGVWAAVANGHWRVGKIPQAVRAMVDDTPAGREFYRRMTELLIVGQGVREGEVRDLIKDVLNERDRSFGPSMSSAMNKRAEAWVRSGGNLAEKLYHAEDAVWKIYAFLNEMEAYRAAYPELSERALEEKVAEIVRNTNQTYPMLGRGIRALRRFPFVGPFVSFPAEVIRNTYHSLKLGFSELQDPRTRQIGANRLAGMTLATVGMSAAVLALRAMMGISDDDERKMRNFMPPWSQNHPILHLGRDSQGRPMYIDLGHSYRYSYFSSPFIAMLRGQDLDQAMRESIWEVLGPFLQEEMLTERLLDVARNHRADGRMVYNPQAPALDVAMTIAGHIGEVFRPGSYDAVSRLWMASTGQPTKTGRMLDPATELTANITGQRMSRVDVQQSLRFQAQAYLRRQTEAARLLTTIQRRPGSTPEQQAQGTREMEAARRQNFDKMRRLVLAAEGMGLSRREVGKILDRAGASLAERTALFSGAYRPRPVSRRQVSR